MKDLEKRINARNSRQMKRIKCDFQIFTSRGYIGYEFNPLTHEEEKRYFDYPRSFILWRQQ